MSNAYYSTYILNVHDESYTLDGHLCTNNDVIPYVSIRSVFRGRSCNQLWRSHTFMTQRRISYCTIAIHLNVLGRFYTIHKYTSIIL